MGVLKKYLGLFGFCLILNNEIAQTAFNVAYHDKSEKSGNVSACFLKINSDYYYSTLRTDAESYYTSYLYKHSDNGQLKFRKPNFLPFIPNKLIKTLDNKLLFVGTEITCDVMPQNPKNFICKMDTDGTIIFINSYAENQFLECRNVLQYTDSSYYSFADSIMYHYDKAGQLILRKNVGLRQVSSLLLHSNGNVIVSATSNSINALCQINTVGVITTTIVTPTLFSKVEFYNGTEILGLGTDNKIHKISNSFSLIGSSNFNSGISLKDFTVSDDTLYCISSSNVESYFMSDTTFNIIYSSTTTANGMKQDLILQDQNRISILTGALSKSSPNFMGGHNYVTLNVFDRYSSNNFDDDIEIMSIIADSSYALVAIPTNSYTPNVYTVFLRAKVKVKNKGIYALNNFKLNQYEFTGSSGCGSFYYQQNFPVTSINTGDSVEVMTAFLQNTIYSFDTLQPVITQSFCVFGTVPNGRADKHYEDNELCKTFSFQVNDVFVKENSLSENSIFFSPNPFNSSIQIRSKLEIKNIDILNCVGQKVKSISLNSGEIKLSLSELTQGIYFLKIETEKGIQIKKVIKN